MIHRLLCAAPFPVFRHAANMCGDPPTWVRAAQSRDHLRNLRTSLGQDHVNDGKSESEREKEIRGRGCTPNIINPARAETLHVSTSRPCERSLFAASMRTYLQSLRSPVLGRAAENCRSSVAGASASACFISMHSLLRRTGGEQGHALRWRPWGQPRRNSHTQHRAALTEWVFARDIGGSKRPALFCFALKRPTSPPPARVRWALHRRTACLRRRRLIWCGCPGGGVHGPAAPT